MKMEISDCLILSCIVLSVIVHVFGCDNSNCAASNGIVCNEQGTCDCGVCKCKGSYSGPTCEECPTCPSTCDIYKDCVGCKIFGTGKLSAMECILQCDYIATFLPSDKSEFDVFDDDRMLCTNLVKVGSAYCMESFKIGGMREGYRDLFVRTEEDCNQKYAPTNPPVIEVTMETTKSEETGPHQKPKDKGHKSEDAGAVSGSNQDQRVGDNGAEHNCLSSILFMIVTIFSLVL